MWRLPSSSSFLVCCTTVFHVSKVEMSIKTQLSEGTCITIEKKITVFSGNYNITLQYLKGKTVNAWLIINIGGLTWEFFFSSGYETKHIITFGDSFANRYNTVLWFSIHNFMKLVLSTRVISHIIFKSSWSTEKLNFCIFNNPLINVSEQLSKITQKKNHDCATIFSHSVFLSAG